MHPSLRVAQLSRQFAGLVCIACLLSLHAFAQKQGESAGTPTSPATSASPQARNPVTIRLFSNDWPTGKGTKVILYLSGTTTVSVPAGENGVTTIAPPAVPEGGVSLDIYFPPGGNVALVDHGWPAPPGAEGQTPIATIPFTESTTSISIDSYDPSRYGVGVVTTTGEILTHFSWDTESQVSLPDPQTFGAVGGIHNHPGFYPFTPDFGRRRRELCQHGPKCDYWKRAEHVHCRVDRLGWQPYCLLRRKCRQYRPAARVDRADLRRPRDLELRKRRLQRPCQLHL